MMYTNIKKSACRSGATQDQVLAKGLQKELKVPEKGLAVRSCDELRGSVAAKSKSGRTGGGSDDIGDISWNVPTVTLRYPSNIPNLPGHNWANAIAMATPIAHKGVIAGAKVQAMTMLDLLTHPEMVSGAWDYFRNTQTKETKYTPLLRSQDQPAIWLNQKIMEQYRPQMQKLYYQPEKYDTYLEQLGIKYPTVRGASTEAH